MHRLKYEALRDISVRTAAGAGLSEICQIAVDNAVRIVGVEAGILSLYDASGNQTESFSSGSSGLMPMMRDLHDKLVVMLRNEFSVESLFLTLDRDGQRSLFAYPVIIGGRNIGTLSGVSSGKRNLALEQDFLEAISSQIALALAVLSKEREPSGDLKKAKTEAIVETAVTINHEINNPLTAVLGNVQLLLVDRDKFDERTQKKLLAIEEAALRIKEVTGKLMKTVEPRVTEYTSGIKMVDIDGTGTDSDEEESKDTEE